MPLAALPNEAAPAP